MANRSKIYGIGLNDSDYPVRVHEMVNGKAKIVYECPIFVTWKDMMKRCYSKSYQKKSPTYKGCKVCREWLSFMNFHSWAKSRIGVDLDGSKLHLDKDLLKEGNKVYSPHTCTFVSVKINNFLLSGGSKTSNLPVGVYWCKPREVYQVFCKDPLGRFSKFLGDVPDIETGSELYTNTKLKYLNDLKLAGYMTEPLYQLLVKRITKI